MKITKFGLLAAVVVAIAGGLSGCGSNVAEQKNTTVRIAHFPNITHSQALVGRANGQFQKALGENTIEWKTFNAGPAEIEALFAGEVDIGYIGAGPAINGYTKSKGDLQIIAGASNGGAILLTRKDVVLKNVGELSGKRIAVPQFGGTQDLSLRNILKENGLKDTTKGGTVEIRQADNPDIKTLLDQGEIDAAFVPEPWGARLISEVKANVLLDEKQVWRNGNYTTAVVVANTKFIKDHPDVIEKFLRTHVELTAYINGNPDQGKEIINAQIKELTGKALAKEILDAAFRRVEVTTNPAKESVVDFVQLSLDAGFIKTAPDLKGLFNFTLLNKVLTEKGLPTIEK
jgi:NitT/TauT family transport system substrate-binding protein